MEERVSVFLMVHHLGKHILYNTSQRDIYNAFLSRIEILLLHQNVFGVSLQVRVKNSSENDS